MRACSEGQLIPKAGPGPLFSVTNPPRKSEWTRTLRLRNSAQLSSANVFALRCQVVYLVTASASGVHSRDCMNRVSDMQLVSSEFKLTRLAIALALELHEEKHSMIMIRAEQRKNRAKPSRATCSVLWMRMHEESACFG